MRGTFANIRLRNEMAPAPRARSPPLPTGEVTSVYEAAERYRTEGVPLAVLAGAEYGSGSSRTDWSAKGPNLLGVRFVVAEGFERIHRSNLVGMGVLPLQYRPGDSAASLGLTGRETLAVRGLRSGISPGQEAAIEATRDDGTIVLPGDGSHRRRGRARVLRAGHPPAGARPDAGPITRAGRDRGGHGERRGRIAPPPVRRSSSSLRRGSGTSASSVRCHAFPNPR